MIITAMLTGGAIMPYTEAAVTTAPATAIGMPNCIKMGATRAPVPSTEAVQDPVIMPGNMMMRVSATRRRRGEPPKAEITARVRAARVPFAWIALMKIIAAIRTRPVSR